MSSNLRFFLMGGAASNLCMLNHVFTSEVLKQNIRDETQTLKRINSFKPEDILEFRNEEKDLRERRLP